MASLLTRTQARAARGAWQSRRLVAPERCPRPSRFHRGRPPRCRGLLRRPGCGCRAACLHLQDGPSAHQEGLSFLARRGPVTSSGRHPRHRPANQHQPGHSCSHAGTKDPEGYWPELPRPPQPQLPIVGGPGVGCTGAPWGVSAGQNWREIEAGRPGRRRGRRKVGQQHAGPGPVRSLAPPGHLRAPRRALSTPFSTSADFSSPASPPPAPPWPPHRELPREGLLAPSAPPPRLVRSRAQHQYLEGAQKC